jgi:transketolase
MTPAKTAQAPSTSSETENPEAQAADKHNAMANAIRALAMDAVQKANSGHPGLPMGAADIATVLFTRVLKFDPKMPDWPDRDRFVLSAGHGSMLLYACLHLLGYEDMTMAELENFRQLGSKTAGHPEFGHAAGIETTTGPLGQGIATALGMALAERLLNERFGDDLVDHHTYVLASDGDLMEGISHEAISLAGHLKLSKLIVLFDDNNISIDGDLSLTESGDQLKRFEAAGWDAVQIDGHDPAAIETALTAAREADRPSLIACRTVIGFGAPNKQGTSGVHGAPLGEDEVRAARATLGWSSPAFDIPADTRDAWRLAGLRSGKARSAWQKRLEKCDADDRRRFETAQRGELPADLAKTITELKTGFAEDKPKLATRNASQTVLDAVNKVVTGTIGGSADLTGSNNTKSDGMEAISADDFSGRFIHYGVREHAMAAAMNGMALHRGLIPYSGTFLVFSDYCRPAIRLAALMKQRVIHVMTHDSIGLGEDGPTHQPVEHLAALRAMPNVNLFRPADATETAECWQLALEAAETPSILALTRQKLEPARTEFSETNLCARGAYELRPASDAAQVSLFATGSEVEIAMAAGQELEKVGIATRVVSVPCFELFEAQSREYRAEIIGAAPVRIAIEAAVRQGWDRYVGTEGGFIGMTGFGASAPYQELYAHFGITAENVVQMARDMLAAIDGEDQE